MSRRPRRRHRVVVAVLVLAAAAGAASASAARLGVVSAGVSTAVASAPCAGPVTVAGPVGTAAPSSAVSVTLPAACGDRRVQVSVLDGSTRVASAEGRVSGAGQLTTDAAYVPAARLTVLATLDGWDVPATWSWTAPAALSCRPVDPAVTATCTVAVVSEGRPGYEFWGSGYRIRLEVTTTSTVPFAWEAVLDLSVTGQAAPGGGTYFPGWPVPAGAWWESWYPASFSPSNLCTVSRSADLPVVVLRGDANWNRTVVAGSTVTSIELGAAPQGRRDSSIESLACR